MNLSNSIKGRLTFFFTLLFSIFSWPGVLPAQGPIDTFRITEIHDEYDLNDHLYYFTETDQALSIDQISKDDYGSSFKKLDRNKKLDPHFIHWIRCVISPDIGYRKNLNNWKLHIGNPELLSFYIYDESGKIIDEQHKGRWSKPEKGDLKPLASDQRLNISLNLEGTNTFYIRYDKKDHQPPKVNVRLSKYDFFESLDYVHFTRRSWFFLGFIFTMIIFNLIVYISTKYRDFLFHGLFIIGVFIFTLDFYGITINLPFVRTHPYLVQLVNYIGLLLMDIGYFQFFRIYLNLEKTEPLWDKILLNFIYVKVFFFIVIAVYYYLTFNEPVADKIAATFLLLQYLSVLFFLYPLYRMKNIKAYYLIAGTMFLFAAILLNAVSLIMSQGIWTFVTELGMSGEIICFSLGLGYRFQELRSEEDEFIRLKELSEFKANLYTNITHEFRTPLTVIQGISELSIDKLNKGQQGNLSNAFNTITRNSNDLLNLVNQMLDLAKLQNKGMKLNLSDENIIELIKESLISFEWLASKKEISIRFDTDHDEIIIQIDKEKVLTIIKNLIANAIKYTPKDGQIDIQLSHIVKNEKKSIQISVTDTGEGIPPDELDHIFDRFYRIDDNKSDIVKGTGIGLSLVKELVGFMNGSIEVTSKLGEGASFLFSLPIINTRSSDPVPIDQEIKELELIDSKVLRKKVTTNEDSPLLLIVEDNRDIIEYLINLLGADYNIQCASDGEEGVEKALEIIPDIIISDIMMPKKDGLALCAELKTNEMTNHIPIILLTAKAEFEDRIKGLETGADAYIIKPFKKEELIVSLRQLNELRKTLQKKFSQFTLIDKPNVQKRENDFIHKVNSLLEEQLLDEQFGAEELSKALYMSRMQLHRKLTALSGRSTSNYIRNYRVHKAKLLLGDRTKSVSEVAWDVGFQDPNYFTKSFQKEFGVTPSEFREQM